MNHDEEPSLPVTVDDCDTRYEYVEERDIKSIPCDCPDRKAAVELLDLMGEISEDYYAAGWLMGLEFSLWRIIFETLDRPQFGLGDLTHDEVGRLIELTYRCQGWWVWDDNLGGCKFLPYDEWIPMYQEG